MNYTKVKCLIGIGGMDVKRVDKEKLLEWLLLEIQDDGLRYNGVLVEETEVTKGMKKAFKLVASRVSRGDYDIDDA